MKDIVSIIIPCYNSAHFICETIESVLGQTYSNWEMIIVDDFSTDNTEEIVKTYVAQEHRIRFIRLEKNSGSATEPRNRGIQEAKGRFIAFLDSDDIWKPEKLEKQLPLFDNPKVAIVYSDYEKIDEASKYAGRRIYASESRTYRQLLLGNVIGCSTVIYDAEKMGKHYFISAGHEDYILWLSILKKGFLAINTQSCLAEYRVRTHSLSSNKLKASLWVWNIYVNIEKLGYLRSIYYFTNYAIRSFGKYLK